MSVQEANLKAIADAIREKDGTTDFIPAGDFPARILAISAVPEGLRTITLSVNDEAGGAVSGGGLAEQGMTVTVEAEAGTGYKFGGWQEDGQTVSEGTKYTFVVAANRALVGTFEEITAGRLPAGYSETEYIEASGGAHINTPIYPSETTNLYVDVQPLNSLDYYCESKIITSTGYNDGDTSNFTIKWTYRGASGGIGTGSDGTIAVLDGSARRLSLRLDANASLFWDGDKSVAPDKVGSNYYPNMGAIAIFESSEFLSVPTRLYSIRIYNGSGLSFEGVPCINPSGAVGLYDLVGGEFYGNAGTGTFTAGPAV